jgi:hypothetical protein
MSTSQHTFGGIVASASLWEQLESHRRVMQSLARACVVFAERLEREPWTEEVLYAVAVEWETLQELLLRVIERKCCSDSDVRRKEAAAG